VEGYERTFAINYLAHAELIGTRLPVLAAPARIVLLGSNGGFQRSSQRFLDH